MHAVDLVPNNLEKVCDLVWDANSKWLDLGIQLHIKDTELRDIERNCTDAGSCLKEMILTWLKTVDPPPSWEGLMAALEHDSVKCGALAESIRQRFGIYRHQPSPSSEFSEALYSSSYLMHDRPAL